MVETCGSQSSARASSSSCLRAEYNGSGLDKLKRLDHVLGSRLVFLEMRRLQMRSVGFCAGINFKHSDVSGVLLFRHGVEDQDSRFYANSSFDVLSNRSFVFF